MHIDTYRPLAVKTESVPASIEMNQFALHALLELAITAGNVMDKVKRRIFYGSAIKVNEIGEHLGQLADLADFLSTAIDSDMDINDRLPYEALVEERREADDAALVSLDDRHLNIRLLHAALGRFTESTEQLEALKAQFEGRGLDIVNYAEEVGDAEWYAAIDKDELLKVSNGQMTEASIRLTNIEKLQGNGKLKGRYDSGDFDAVRALRRDLTAERAILEKGGK